MPSQAGRTAGDKSLDQHERRQIQTAKASPASSSPPAKPSRLATPAQTGQQRQRVYTPATATATVQQARQQAHFGSCPTTSPAQQQPHPGFDSLLEAVLPTGNMIDSGSAGRTQVAEAEAGKEPQFPLVSPQPITIDFVIASAVKHVSTRRGKKVTPYGAGGSSQQLDALWEVQLFEAESSQTEFLKQDPPQYCTFIRLQRCWDRLLGRHLQRFGQDVTLDERAAAAQEVVRQWIQDLQQTFGTLLPAEDDASLNDQADVHKPMLPHPTLSAPAAGATLDASQATTPGRHAYLVTAADLASPHKQADGDDQLRQAVCDTHPTASANTESNGFIPLHPLVADQSVGSNRWQPRSPMSNCQCSSCVAWQTGKQLARSYTDPNPKPYASRPVGTHNHECCMTIKQDMYMSQCLVTCAN